MITQDFVVLQLLLELHWLTKKLNLNISENIEILREFEAVHVQYFLDY